MTRDCILIDFNNIDMGVTTWALKLDNMNHEV